MFLFMAFCICLESTAPGLCPKQHSKGREVLEPGQPYFPTPARDSQDHTKAPLVQDCLISGATLRGMSQSFWSAVKRAGAMRVHVGPHLREPSRNLSWSPGFRWEIGELFGRAGMFDWHGLTYTFREAPVSCQLAGLC